MTRSIRLISLLFLTSAATLGCQPSTRSGSDCQTDADCTGLTICRAERCVAVECLGDEDCPVGDRCEGNLCQTPDTCASDADCQEPTPLCDPQTGNCVACIPQCQGWECGPDGCGGTCQPGCPAGQTCEQGICQACQPACADWECGPDGCGGNCAPGCDPSQSCSDEGQCVCVPDCADRQCGPDGCGGACEPGCQAGDTCGPDGQCQTCQPACLDRQCGPDGCGGLCGPGCQAPQVCDDQGLCTCQPDCHNRQCGPDSCGGLCEPGCEQNQTCTAQGTCQSCQPDCAGLECGPDPVCGSECGPCPADENCSLAGQCGPWCQSGEQRCSQDGFGFQACGPDPELADELSFGGRVPCLVGDACDPATGTCQHTGCLDAELIVLLDRSSSMLDQGTWDWTVPAVLDAIDQRERANLFGFRHFPGQEGCEPGVLIGLDHDNKDTIEAALNQPEAASATPIQAALEDLLPHFGDPNDGQAVVLLTDGDETCGDQAGAIAAAGALHRGGVAVHVVGLTQMANRAFLDQLAQAGGTGAARLAADGPGLTLALEAVFTSVDACLCTPEQWRCLDEDQLFTCGPDRRSYALTQVCDTAPDACHAAAGTCQSGQCVHPTQEGPCDDGDACTTQDYCSWGECRGGPSPCGDGDPCTEDACDDGACSYPPAQAGQNCDDGDPCTPNDECDGQGACLGGAGCTDQCSWYPDEDDDFYGDWFGRVCQESRPAGYVNNDSDCCDSDPNSHPMAFGYQSVPNACGDFDWDCDYTISRRWPEGGMCFLLSGTCYIQEGCWGAPACGDVCHYVYSCDAGCYEIYDSWRVQECY